jgi:hypothetical protein
MEFRASYLKRFARRDHDANAFLGFADKSGPPPIAAMRVIPTHTLCPGHLSGLCIDTACDAAIGDKVKFPHPFPSAH